MQSRQVLAWQRDRECTNIQRDPNFAKRFVRRRLRDDQCDRHLALAPCGSRPRREVLAGGLVVGRSQAMAVEHDSVEAARRSASRDGAEQAAAQKREAASGCSRIHRTRSKPSCLQRPCRRGGTTPASDQEQRRWPAEVAPRATTSVGRHATEYWCLTRDLCFTPAFGYVAFPREPVSRIQRRRASSARHFLDERVALQGAPLIGWTSFADSPSAA